MGKLADELCERSKRDALIVGSEIRAAIQECRDALEECQERLADVEGALYQSFLDNGCTADEAKVYMMMAVGSQDGRAALESAGEKRSG